jgi:hypothetical protein
MAAENAVVIEQGREPKRVESLCTLLMGLGVMFFAFWPVARGIQLERARVVARPWAIPIGAGSKRRGERTISTIRAQAAAPKQLVQTNR